MTTSNVSSVGRNFHREVPDIPNLPTALRFFTSAVLLIVAASKRGQTACSRKTWMRHQARVCHFFSPLQSFAQEEHRLKVHLSPASPESLTLCVDVVLPVRSKASVFSLANSTVDTLMWGEGTQSYREDEKQQKRDRLLPNFIPHPHVSHLRLNLGYQYGKKSMFYWLNHKYIYS